MTNIDNAHDEEPLAWCPGCGDRILTRVVRERGVCSNCYDTTDDPWATQQALAEAWAEGHRTGWENCQDGNYGDDYWDDPTPNPHAAAARTETTTGAIARGEALAAGDPDWMNVTRWPRTEAEATTVILRLIAENRRLTDIENGWRHDRSEWEAERDALAAKVARVEALAAE